MIDERNDRVVMQDTHGHVGATHMRDDHLVTPVDGPIYRSHRRISWSAILVGALVAVGLGFLLNIFGMAIGLSAVTMNSDGTDAIAIGGYLGFVISVVAAMFVAGYASGYLGRLCCPQRNLGILYGFTTWTLAIILSALLMGYVGDYLSTYNTNMSAANPVAAAADAGTSTNGNVVSTEPVTIKTAASSTEPAKSVQVTPSAGNMATAAYLLFALFFLGALASCLGACWGMCCDNRAVYPPCILNTR